MNQMAIKERVLAAVGEAIQNRSGGDGYWSKTDGRIPLQEMMDEEGFFFEENRNVYNAFMEDDINKDELARVWEIAIQHLHLADDIRDELTSKEYSLYENASLVDKLDEVIANFDTHGRNSATLHVNKPPRFVATTMVRQNIWYKELIRHRLGKRIKSDSIRNLITYIKDPENNVSMVSQKHRVHISEVVLGRRYDTVEFVTGLKEMFANYREQVKDDINYTLFISACFYTDSIQRMCGLK